MMNNVMLSVAALDFNCGRPVATRFSRPAGPKNDRQKKKSTMLPQAKAMLCVSSMLVGIVDR
jgi:hypothetical protein